MDILVKLAFLFLGVDLVVYGIFTLSFVYLILGILNIVFLFIFCGDSLKTMKDSSGKFIAGLLHINRHYLFSSTLLVFIFVLFSKIVGFYKVDLNIYPSFFILVFSILIGYKDIFSGNIYFGNKKLFLIDYVLFTSISVFYIFFNINGLLDLHERFLLGSLSSMIFYVFTINFLGLVENKYGKYKVSFYFLVLFMISLIYFLYGFLNIFVNSL